jgi:hypothetical protein
MPADQQRDGERGGERDREKESSCVEKKVPSRSYLPAMLRFICTNFALFFFHRQTESSCVDEMCSRCIEEELRVLVLVLAELLAFAERLLLASDSAVPPELLPVAVHSRHARLSHHARHT